MKKIWNADELMEQAQERTGLTDWGEEDLRRPLEILCYSLNHEAGLNDAGIELVQQRLSNILAGRLQLMADRDNDPLIAQQEIKRPLVVLGFPRSGTSHTHSLLAADPGTRSPRFWEMTIPSPPPRKDTYETDPRIAMIEEDMESSGFFTDELMAIHPFSASAPEECGLIIESAGYGAMFTALCWVPTYTTWRENVDFRPAMRYHRQFLQHLQAYNPGKWWVLKAPEYTLHIEEILSVYPDACIVMTHRDPAKTLPSEISLYQGMRKLTTDAKHYSPQDAGRAVLNCRNLSAERVINLRRRLGDDPRFIDVHYQDILARPLEVVEGIYKQLGLDLTDAARESMQRYLDNHRQNRHGVHKYSLEEYGLTAEDIEENFSEYFEYFGVQREDRK